jgi:hypothetical protein
MILALAIAVSATLGSVRADGEAGLIIDYGRGRVEQHCIAFQGDDASGEQLLAAVGADVNQFAGLVCSLNDVGCQHTGTFDSCTCECKSSGGGCTYWTFFQKRYKATWLYSSLGFENQRARDGDLQSWTWQEGQAASAPAPVDVSFESICGHPPLSLSTAIPAPTSTPLPPTATSTPVPPLVTITASAATATRAGTTPVAVTQSPTNTPAVTATSTAMSSPEPTSAPRPSTTATSTPSVAPPLSGDSDPTTRPTTGPGPTIPQESDDGGGATTLIFFGLAAAVLLAGIGGAAYWRRSNG